MVAYIATFSLFATLQYVEVYKGKRTGFGEDVDATTYMCSTWVQRNNLSLLVPFCYQLWFRPMVSMSLKSSD